MTDKVFDEADRVLQAGTCRFNSGVKSDGAAIVSGGLDSVTMTYQLVQQGHRPHLLSFNYGQRHAKELNCALWTAERLNLNWTLVDLTTVTELIGTSALTFGHSVPEGHYAEDNMALTVVPNRNMMMLSIAAAACVSNRGSYIATGVHAGDHAQYPDCRLRFIEATQEAIFLGNEGFVHPKFEIKTPFIDWSKAEIAHEAFRLGVPLDKTWSCYKGTLQHCGRCGTCVERLEAIADVTEAGEDWDQTPYLDKEYWKTAVAEYQREH
jgi:7-cyano-7-deazaguanine synthase